MTFVVTALFGAGVIFIVSAIENSSLSDTLKKVMNGEKLDLTIQGGE